MMLLPIDTLALFFMTAVALGFAPGPDNIFVLTQSALYGRLSGIAVTLGLCTGLIVHTLAVALGVAVIFQTSEMAFTLLKTIGAAYLVYLAWGAWRAGTSELPSGQAGQQGPSYKKLYLRGIVMNITNPKIAIFFMAFLPQFADPSRGLLSYQLIELGLVFIVAGLAVFFSIAWSAGFLGAKLRKSPSMQQIMNRFVSVIFIGLAVRLALAER
jgi:threonine/homoserine/homoserine lactone efflux protein